MSSSFTITKKDAGKKVLVFLKERFGATYSVRQLKKGIDRSLFWVNGKPERFSTAALKEGDRVLFHEEDIVALPKHSVQLERNRILYEDEEFLVYDKPAGVPSDAKGVIDLFPQYRLIHRLDRDTSGVLMLSKSKQFLEKMKQCFRQQNVEKFYLALVDGAPKKASGVVENQLGKVGYLPGQTLWGPVKKGVYACTEWKLHRQGKGASLLLCKPKTGRTHQIRVHLSGMGHPILGDFQYGKRFSCSYRPLRHMLHAWKVTFSHPDSGKLLTFEAPIPDDFNESMTKVIES